MKIFKIIYNLEGQLLHAKSLGFIHPTSINGSILTRICLMILKKMLNLLENSKWLKNKI